jgi:hypothetical protein
MLKQPIHPKNLSPVLTCSLLALPSEILIIKSASLSTIFFMDINENPPATNKDYKE